MRVRLATTADVDVLRSLRLQAMADAEHAFQSNRAREEARTPAEWRAWLEQGATFFLEVDGDGGDARPVGLAVGAVDDDDPARAWLLSMWVDPGARATGGADELVVAVVDWARKTGARVVRLHVVDGNDRARRVYERHGFLPTGSREIRERDGAVEIEMGRAVDDPVARDDDGDHRRPPSERGMAGP
jgi:RimJ/RimL family protein N-acetyltransferase